MAEKSANSDEEPTGDTAEEQAAPEGIHTTVTRNGDCECTIRIEADADYLRERYEEQVASLQSELALPGFRKGRAPRGLLERRMAGTIKTRVLSSVLEEAFDAAVRDNDLNVVAELESPDVENLEWEAGQPGEFEFRCEILPKIELEQKQYKGIRVEIPTLEVTSEIVQEELDRFAGQFKSWEKVEEGGIDWQDRVECEVRVARQAGMAADWSQQVEFVPAQERIGPFVAEGIKGRLLGAKAGDVVKLNARLVEEAAAQIKELRDLAGQEVPIEMNITAVLREKTPELNDEFARRFNLDSVDDVHRIIREKLEKDMAKQHVAWTDFMIIGTIIDNVALELPPSIVERAAAEEERRAAIRVLRRGGTMDEALKEREEMAKRSHEIAARNLKAVYILKEIAERERIYVSEEEVQEQIRAIAAREGWTERKTERTLEEQEMLASLRAEMREMKTRAFLRQNATVEQIEPALFEQRYAERLPGDRKAGRIEVAG